MIRDGNKDVAIECFAEWAAPQVDSFGSENKIPIPSSRTTEDSLPNFRTEIIAEKISEKCQTPVIVLPIIRWQKEKIPSRSGGPRDPRSFLQ